MIQETVVLLWIKHLQKGASRISIDSTTNLVNLIDKYKRIFRPNTLKSLDNLARERTKHKSILMQPSSTQNTKTYPT